MVSPLVYSQTSEKYNSGYENYYRAEGLFEKEQYAAARQEFSEFLTGVENTNDPMYVKASYYQAISALELYNKDAESLLKEFNKNYPESIYKKDIYFRLGKYYYYKKKNKEALLWLNKVIALDLEEEDRDEYYFKKGYANFREKNFDEARSAFYEVKDGDSHYAPPALYYYSHIAYQNESYQIALTGFLKLEGDKKFGKVVPYYIAQIYYLQGKYEEVTNYAERIESNGSIVNEKDLNHLIGDAFYRTGKYKEAVPYLEKYNKATKTSREEDYRLGFAYYKSGKYNMAIRLFDRVKKEEDSLGQIAYYHIGESLLKLDNQISARSAFEGAAFIDMDPVVQEDALYNYAILSYKLDINPYDEAVEAFEMYLSKYANSERTEDVYQYLVNVYMSTNNYAKALASLDKIPNRDITLKTAYQLIAFNQGVERFQKANFTGAISSFKLVDKHPIDPALNAQSAYWIADANYRLKRYDLAIQGYKQVAVLPAIIPDLIAETHYSMGYAYLKKKDKAKSIEEFRIFTQSKPKSDQKKADALMRIADAYFVMKENEQAVKYYKEALALKSGYEDQALFYMAKTFGYMNGMIDKKIEHLLDLVKNYKGSKYSLISIYEVANSYKSKGSLDEALIYYKKIVFDYPSSVLVVGAKIDIADIYFKQSNYAKAEEEYNKILDLHGEDKNICEKAVRGLIEIYTVEQELEKIDPLIAKYACANFTADEQEDLYYLPVINAYNDSLYDQTISLCEKYLLKFSDNGRYSADVKIYLANSHYSTGNIVEAVNVYMETLEGPNNGFTELAASRVAKYLYNEGRYEEVIKYYVRLEKISSIPEVIFNSELGLMRSYFLIENWNASSIYADKVLGNSQINDDMKLEAYYAKGMSNFYLEKFDAAKVSLVWVIKNTTTVKAAEARYSLAESYYKQNHLDNAQEEITALIKQRPAYNYWIARGLILKSRILILQQDLFQAEQVLKSVLDHYTVTEDGILTEANQLWDELMQLKEGRKAIEPETNITIEINENGGD
jgi:tetratricopeptide (TPR) repeat protein